MEKSMYYGTFIYKYIEATKKVENISELDSDTQNAYNAGYYTVNSIKYVYRGAENIEDESTQNSLKKAQEALL
jgi:hypothetical protein